MDARTMKPAKRPYGFPKPYRLKRRKLIEALVAGGRSVFAWPVKAVYLPVEQLPGNVPFQATVTVSRKKFRKAVRRNHIKRLMREAFRLEQAHLQSPHPVAVLLIYVAREEVPLDTLRQAMQRVLAELSDKIRNHGQA